MAPVHRKELHRAQCARRQLLATVASGLFAGSVATEREHGSASTREAATNPALRESPPPECPSQTRRERSPCRSASRTAHNRRPRCRPADPPGGPSPALATCTPPCPAERPLAWPSG